MAETTADLERALAWADRSTDPLFKALAAEVKRLRAQKEPVSAEALAVGMRFCCGHAEKLSYEIGDLRNVAQVALLSGDRATVETWNKYFPDQARPLPEGNQND